MEKEQEKELRKLLNVLRRMGRTARMNQWTGTRDQADAYTVDQYNRVLARLKEVAGPGGADLFPSLPEGSSWGTVSNACRDVTAYYEDETEEAGERRKWAHWDGVWTDAKKGIWIDRTAFEGEMPPEVNELGHFIREKIAEWQERRRAKE